MKLVKVARVGDKVREVAIGEEGTVRDALTAAELTQEANEVIFINHTLITSSIRRVMSNDLIILEEKKLVAMNPGMIDFINLLFDMDIIKVDDYEDDTYSIDYHEAYRDNKEIISQFISKAKEA